MYMSSALSDYEKLQKITAYCKNLGNYDPNGNYGQMANRSGCNGAGSAVMPLSKTKSGLNTSTNTTSQSCKMNYAQKIRNFGTTQNSTPAITKKCFIGNYSFSY
jgi:chitodextrinase